MHTVFHWIMIATLIGIGVWAWMVFGQLFRAHMIAFLFLWLFLPVVALWLNTQAVLSQLSVSSLTVVRGLLFGIVAATSFCFLIEYDHIRDSLGQQFIAGYEAHYYEDANEYGRPFMAVDISTGHWYSRFGLWLFEWAFLSAGFVLPFLTWRAASRAVDKAIQYHSPHDDAT